MEQAYLVVNKKFEKNSIYAYTPLASVKGAVKFSRLVLVGGVSHLEEITVEGEEFKHYQDKDTVFFLFEQGHRVDVGTKIKIYFESWESTKSFQGKSIDVVDVKAYELFDSADKVLLSYIDPAYMFVHDRNKLKHYRK